MVNSSTKTEDVFFLEQMSKKKTETAFHISLMTAFVQILKVVLSRIIIENISYSKNCFCFPNLIFLIIIILNTFMLALKSIVCNLLNILVQICDRP